MIAKRILFKNLLVAILLLLPAASFGEARPDLSTPKICFDMIPPRDLNYNRPHRTLALGDPMRAILVIRKMWPNGSVLRVRFLGGDPNQRAMVKKFASQWNKLDGFVKSKN